MDNKINKLADYYVEKYGLRKGQAVFNAAYRLSPKKANQYRGTDIDPFYNDALIEAFLEKFKE